MERTTLETGLTRKITDLVHDRAVLGNRGICNDRHGPLYGLLGCILLNLESWSDVGRRV